MCKWSIKALKTGSFPDSFKGANVRPQYKKVDPFDNKNYRWVSILPLLLKVYERVIYEQVSNYFEPSFNEILCGFRKEHIRSMLQQTSLSRGGLAGYILIDLPKSYDFLKDNLLLAKLQAYGFSKNV